MKFTKEIVDSVKNFIINNVEKHPNDLTKFTAEHFEISLQTSKKYIDILIDEEIIEMNGKGKKPQYTLKAFSLLKVIEIDKTIYEDTIWTEYVKPFIGNVRDNVYNILIYGFTEMVNNALDHSGAESLAFSVKYDYLNISIGIMDNGIGIFNKIQKDLGLAEPKQAILELYKGKFTSDPANHTGEGIFFTSRAFDKFIIESNKLRFHGHDGLDIVFEVEKNFEKGTYVFMKIRKDSDLRLSEVFDKFSTPDSNPGFFKTIVPLQVMECEGEKLVSRSQAKRLITRFDRFQEVILDFEGVSVIGQAFADQLFRIFKRDNPDVKITVRNTNSDVRNMISHVQSFEDVQ